jgi:hypothetical protein
MRQMSMNAASPIGPADRTKAAKLNDEQLIEAIRDAWDNFLAYENKLDFCQRRRELWLAALTEERESRPSLAGYDWKGAKVA